MRRNAVLDADACGHTCRFLAEKGRPLEVALFRHHFAGGSAASVIEALSGFRNADGGFGRAIEPDLRAPESSAIGTSVALQVLREVGALHDSELAAGARSYLLATLDRAQACWRIVPEAVEASPHAPWWNQTGRDHGYDRFSLNPTAELLGYFCAWNRPEDREVIDLVAAAVVRELARSHDIEMHDLLCVLRLHASPGLPSALRTALERVVPRAVARAVLRDPAGWRSYGLRPLQVVDSPTSPFFPGLETAVAQNLDYLVETQEPDGSWAPTWSWGEAWPEVWEEARTEWSGVLTLRTLLVLKRFGRLRMLNAT